MASNATAADPLDLLYDISKWCGISAGAALGGALLCGLVLLILGIAVTRRGNEDSSQKKTFEVLGMGGVLVVGAALLNVAVVAGWTALTPLVVMQDGWVYERSKKRTMVIAAINFFAVGGLIMLAAAGVTCLTLFHFMRPGYARLDADPFDRYAWGVVMAAGAGQSRVCRGQRVFGRDRVEPCTRNTVNVNDPPTSRRQERSARRGYANTCASVGR